LRCCTLITRKCKLFLSAVRHCGSDLPPQVYVHTWTNQCAIFLLATADFLSCKSQWTDEEATMFEYETLNGEKYLAKTDEICPACDGISMRAPRDSKHRPISPALLWAEHLALALCLLSLFVLSTLWHLQGPTNAQCGRLLSRHCVSEHVLFYLTVLTAYYSGKTIARPCCERLSR